MTPKETSADALTDEQKKRIASIVHTDCTLIPGATFYNASELAIAETLAALPVPVDKPAPSPADERAAFDLRDVLSDTGNPEADRLIGRLTSADPDFNDCTDAAVFIRRIVAEHRGPDGFATWKDAALAERMRRVQSKPSTETLRSLFIEAMDFGIGFGPRLSQVGEWADARDLKADGFVARAASANETGAEGALGYAQRLATGLWEKHWRDSAPQWKVLDDMLGVLTQIDKMVCGLSRSPAMAAEADDDAPDIATFCELLGSYGRVMSSRDFPNDERYAAREDVINAYRAALRETAGDAPATSAEAVAIHQAIHQVWIEETSSWADVTPAYYAERQPSNRRRVYYAPQPPAQADAIAEIDPPQAVGNKGRLPALARTREGHNLYSLGYNRGLKKGRDEPAQADAREGLTEQAITDAVKKWFPDRAYKAPFFARALLNGANR